MTGELTWKEWTAGVRSALKSYGGGWPMSDFKAEMSRLYRRPADEVLKEGWSNGEDPDEFVSGVADSLACVDRGYTWGGA